MADPNITINPTSEITAGQWVEMIKRSPHVPQYVKQDLKAKGNTIGGPAKIRQPANTIPREWPDDLAAAFASRHWEITTAQETFALVEKGTEIHVQRRFLLGLQSGEFGPGHWLTTGPNQREWSPDNRDLVASFPLSAVEFLFGATFSSEEVNKHVKKGERSAATRLTSQRALIIIVNKVTVIGVPPTHFFTSWFPGLAELAVTSRQFTVPEDKLVASFLHEVGAHAGRMSQGKGANHGDPIVESNVTEIEEMFPKDPTLNRQVAAALAEAEGRLKEVRLRASAKGRVPGPLQGASAKGRVPGPLR